MENFFFWRDINLIEWVILINAYSESSELLEMAVKLIRARQIERKLTESSPLADNFLPIFTSVAVTEEEKLAAFTAFGALAMGREKGDITEEVISEEKQGLLREGQLLSGALREVAYMLHFGKTDVGNPRKARPA